MKKKFGFLPFSIALATLLYRGRMPTQIHVLPLKAQKVVMYIAKYVSRNLLPPSALPHKQPEDWEK
jgi:hypothetical protein